MDFGDVVSGRLRLFEGKGKKKLKGHYLELVEDM